MFSIFLVQTAEVFSQETATGYVYHDLNKNGKRDSSEPGLQNVLVSNGEWVASTDQNGYWELPVEEGTGIFIIKPSGYAVPLNDQLLPQHYYWHLPTGSPHTEVPGIEPTGALPESIDFALYGQHEENQFEVLLFGDPQARGLKEVNYISHDVVEECIGSTAKLGITLGDIVADDPALFAEVSESLAQIGIPWYYVFGNHDHNRDVQEDSHRDSTFKRFFGPSTYAFEYGEVAFIILRDIHYAADGKYISSYTDEQLSFVSNYLEHLPEEKLVVLVQHAPIIRTEGRDRMYRLLEKRVHSISISGHTHTMNHVFIDEEMGWKGPQPHHHFINATVSGSWWCGLKDETGIPHATMNDGAPNGYSILSFDGTDYRIRFKAARRPDNYQMNIHLADDINLQELDKEQVIVNVFSGSEKSKVKMKIGGKDEWIPLAFTPMPDPHNAWMHSLSPFLDVKLEDGSRTDEALGWKMDPPGVSQHIWSGPLPHDLAPGTYHLQIRTKDMFGQEWEASRIFRVR
ncbi:calcineurin-like phosphoesterase C-terminal domain-containing protein [Negadavirga shengliensis]|uniref:Calcineurin-like phosphoesterase C-terminal domain-containing protein n=1 Tax=Negadavirga shengliensis TaxID=1389218 RepID=A0ABV9T0F6_9BACT